MPAPRHKRILHKAIGAFVAAVEIYNKPDFKYREEAFAVLAINGWELLLKSKLVKDADGKIQAIYEYKSSKDGRKLQKPRIEKNRCGNPKTLSLAAAVNKLLNHSPPALQREVAENIFALLEIRDNAIHFYNRSFELSRTIQELGTASLKNFVAACKEWFPEDQLLKRYNFYLMPLAFLREITSADLVVLNDDATEQGNFLRYVQKTYNDTQNEPNNTYAFALGIDFTFRKASSSDLVNVQITNDPSAMKVHLSEDDIQKRFPYTHDRLRDFLKTRYSNFDYSQFKKQLEDFKRNKNICYPRKYNPDNPKSHIQYRYAPKVLEHFDKMFIQKKSKVS